MYKLGKLIPLETYAMSIPKYHRFDAFMRQATLHSIIADLDDIIESEKAEKFPEVSIWILEAFIKPHETKKLLALIPTRIKYPKIGYTDTWIITDEFGSGYDSRFTDISWMDTREKAVS